MRQLLALVAAAAGAAAAMYWFDPDLGPRRRAQLRQRLVGNDPQHELHGQQRDAQLRERVQSRLGSLVSHPGAIEVAVEEGIVRLSGDVLASELDGLLTQVRDMAGVRRVINALGAHQSPRAMTATAAM